MTQRWPLVLKAGCPQGSPVQMQVPLGGRIGSRGCDLGISGSNTSLSCFTSVLCGAVFAAGFRGVCNTKGRRTLVSLLGLTTTLQLLSWQIECGVYIQRGVGRMLALSEWDLPFKPDVQWRPPWSDCNALDWSHVSPEQQGGARLRRRCWVSVPSLGAQQLSSLVTDDALFNRSPIKGH